MGKIQLSSVIMGSMKDQGYLATGGDNHNGEANKLDNRLTGKGAMGNDGDLNPDRSKPKSKNPGVDMAFWAKGDPQEDTTGHGKLTSGCK